MIEVARFAPGEDSASGQMQIKGEISEAHSVLGAVQIVIEGADGWRFVISIDPRSAAEMKALLGQRPSHVTSADAEWSGREEL